MSRVRWSESDLSAYLDDRLDQARRVALEADLARDPALRRQLAGLRQTVALLRAMPLREPPRNFLLTPAMVASASPRPRPFLLPFLRLATALTGLAFILTVGLEMLPRFGGAAAPRPALAPQAKAPTDRIQQTDTPLAEIVALNEGTAEPLAAAPSLAETPATPLPDETLRALPGTPEPEPMLEATGIGGGPGMGGGEPGIQAPTLILTVTSAPSGEPTAPAWAPPAPLEPASPTLAPTETGGPASSRETRARGSHWLLPLLGLSTLGLGALTWWLGRRNS